ncbi:MAG TPA: dihydroorotate dehydrogenase-like protein [Anaerolineae bacterium]|nr:dihydroorotate dehydrogenase-like protein [Anaerolineae bacterium]
MDLSTSYLNIPLKNPLVPSSSPLMRDLGNLRHMEDAGAAAVILHSLFEEEILQEEKTLDAYLNQGAESFAEALSYLPEAPQYHSTPHSYLNYIEEAKAALDIPVIASLNGASLGGWVNYARLIEEAGADALELNIYYLPTDPNLSSLSVELIYLDILRQVKETVNIPVVMKLSPYFSNMARMATQLDEAGADGLALFNRFYQPDFDLENLEVWPNLRLSQSSEQRLPLRWIALLYGQLQADLALTTGVHTAEEALKGVAAGAAITMTTSALLQNGIDYITELLLEMTYWLNEHDYTSLQQLRGSLSQQNCAEPDMLTRANYVRVLNSYTT